MDKSKLNKKAAAALLLKGYFTAGKVWSPRSKFMPIYPNHRIFFSHPDRMKVLAEEIAKAIKPMKVDLVASREAAGVPFGVAAALKLNKGFLYLRKEPKDYSLKSIILGDHKAGQKVVIVDDGMARGGDKNKAKELLEKSGLKVVGVVVIFDAFYQKYFKKQKWLREGKKYKLVSLVRWPDLMKFAAQSKFLGAELCEMIAVYSRDPLAWQKKKSNWKRFKELAAKEKNLIFHESFKDIK
jgi:orotate phosphoribosyltransferase